MEKEHRKHSSFAKYSDKLFLIKQEYKTEYTQRIAGKRAQKTQF